VVVRAWQPVTHEKTVKTLAVVWQVAHGIPACRPDVIGNWECVNVPWVHSESLALWHDSHVVGKPAAVWFGFVVCWYCVKWHATHAVGVPR
jgi:hypothetical protein